MDFFNHLVARLNPLAAAPEEKPRSKVVDAKRAAVSKQPSRRRLRSEWHLTKRNEKRSSSRQKKARRRIVTQRRGLPPSPVATKAKTLKQRAKLAKPAKPAKLAKLAKPAKSGQKSGHFPPDAETRQCRLGAQNFFCCGLTVFCSRRSTERSTSAKHLAS